MIPWAKGLYRRWSSDTNLYHDTHIHSLPTELLLQVSGHLSLSDVACLTLTSHLLQAKLDHDTWRALRPKNGNDEDRQDFLRRLARDTDGRYFFCHTCANLHQSCRLGPPGLLLCPELAKRFLLRKHRSKDKIRSLVCMRDVPIQQVPLRCFKGHRGDSYYELRFQHVQLAMSRHRRGGHHGIPLSWLAMTEVQRQFGDDWTTLMSVEPIVINDELFMRVQQCIMFEGDPMESLVHCSSPWDVPPICNHIAGLTAFEVLEKLLQCKIQHANKEQGCPMCHELLQCTLCGVEFTVDTGHLEAHDRIMVLSKWLNLGRGVSPTEAQWRLKCFETFGKKYIPITKADTLRSISKNFEEQHDVSLDVLTQTNVCSLLGRAYEKTFARCPFRGSNPTWVRQIEPTAGIGGRSLW